MMPRFWLAMAYLPWMNERIVVESLFSVNV
jgi:hypothetical protein